jgi:tripartite-type tricarboxylate transporter receptor subunit TctC
MRSGLKLCVSVVMAATAMTASAQVAPFPSKPIRIIVPYTPAGTTDILARMIAPRLTEVFGQPVIIENKPGANGNVGTEQVARAPADGHTMVMGTVAPFGINPSLYKMNFDPIKDFAPVSLVATVSNVLVLNPSVPAKTLPELLAYMKANPGKISFGSPGNGSSAHLSGELFKNITGTYMVHIPYRGSAGVIGDLIGGQIQLAIDNMPPYMPHIKAGKVRALGVSSAKRSAAAPELATLQELGLKDYDVSSWFGLYLPAGTPKDVVAKISVEVQKFLREPAVREKLVQMGADPVGNTPEEFATFTKNEIDRWARVVKSAGVKLD